MTTNELKLWQKIKDFNFDKQNVKLTFAKRLERENNFTPSFAKEVIEEYKKFIFLCCVSKQQVTPSHYIDLAWHLHLTYTKSYWIDLCQNTIGKEIHHNPTEGGKAENDKFKNFYDQTIELYKEKFGVNPPINIWQKDNGQFKLKLINIDKSKNWIIAKPVFSNLMSNVSLFGILMIISVLFYSCNFSNGSAILILFFIVIIVAIIQAIRYSIMNRQNNSNSDASSSGCSTNSMVHSNDSNADTHNDSNDGNSNDSGCSSGDSGSCSSCGGGD